jgi:DNA-directed RNA polymerase specialized sigma24 family protein
MVMMSMVGTKDRVRVAYETQVTRLWRAVYAYSGRRDIADDAVAEAFAQVLRRGDEVRDVTAWVWRAAFRIAAGELKSAATRPQLLIPNRAVHDHGGRTMNDTITPRFEVLDQVPVPDLWDEIQRRADETDWPATVAPLSFDAGRRRCARFAMTAGAVVAAISGSFDQVEADTIAAALASGSLPVEVTAGG